MTEISNTIKQKQKRFKNTLAMNIPKIISVQPLDDYELMIEFSNHEYRQYDVKPLLKKEMFAPLESRAFFKNVKIEQGGYAVSWNEDIDISEYELWANGKIQQQHQRVGTGD